jgi:hypothetical protein
MQLHRTVGLIDLGVATIVVLSLVMPAREMYASSAQKADEAGQFALAQAEARMLARPDDGAAVDELSRRLGIAGFKDWAIEVAMRGSERAKQSPTRWRALLATSDAFLDRARTCAHCWRTDVVAALDYATRALSACEDQPPACPAWEKTRISLDQRRLDAGVKSGIDPHRGPQAAAEFHRIWEGALRPIRLGGHDGERSATPAPGPGSNGSSTPPGER